MALQSVDLEKKKKARLRNIGIIASTIKKIISNFIVVRKYSVGQIATSKWFRRSYSRGFILES